MTENAEIVHFDTQNAPFRAHFEGPFAVQPKSPLIQGSPEMCHGVPEIGAEMVENGSEMGQKMTKIRQFSYYAYHRQNPGKTP